MGRPGHDWDLTTSARPEDIERLIAGWADTVWDVGREFGTIALRKGAAHVEITTYRSDEYDLSSRKPQVRFGDSLVGDLSRRDFTVNAMAVLLRTSEGEAVRWEFVDPQIATATRTARLRVEVPNRGGRLRLGMYADVILQPVNTSAALPVIPRTAVQQIGDRTVVYLRGSAGSDTFIEREVRLGASDGDRFDVLAGLAVGDLIVTRGSFFLRAERERIGLRTPDGNAAVKTPG
jgi:multidrug efflux pump subunit AcrA (membrane-fusion protein)